MIIDPTGERIEKGGPCICGSRNLRYEHGCGSSNQSYEHATKTHFNCFCRCEDCSRVYIARSFEYGNKENSAKPDYWEGFVVMKLVCFGRRLG